MVGSPQSHTGGLLREEMKGECCYIVDVNIYKQALFPLKSAPYLLTGFFTQDISTLLSGLIPLYVHGICQLASVPRPSLLIHLVVQGRETFEIRESKFQKHVHQARPVNRGYLLTRSYSEPDWDSVLGPLDPVVQR